MKYPQLNIITEKALDAGTFHENQLITVPEIRPSERTIRPLIERRTAGTLANKGYYLDDTYDWVIVQEPGHESAELFLTLVPLKKS